MSLFKTFGTATEESWDLNYVIISSKSFGLFLAIDRESSKVLEPGGKDYEYFSHALNFYIRSLVRK